MTGWWFVPLGLLVVALAVIDELRTTVGVSSGSGPVTRAVTGLLWRPLRRSAVADSRLLRALGGPGVLVVLATLMTWWTLLWLGWALVFTAQGETVVTSTGSVEATTWQRFYFSAYTVVTLGNGEYQPTGAGAQLATGVAALTGMLLITLGVSYLTAVISAVVDKRSFAEQVTGLGATGPELAAGLAAGGSAASVVVPLSSLSSALTTLAQQHRAYPLLHFFRPGPSGIGTAPAVATLLDAVLLLWSQPDPATRPAPGVCRSVVSAAQAYVTHAPASRPRPAPPLDAQQARDSGIDVDDATLAGRVEEHRQLRDELAGRMADVGFDWPGARP